MNLKLNQLPDQIAVQQKKLLDVERSLRTVNHQIDAIVQESDLLVQFDDTLKNDGQRRVRRQQLLQQTGYATFLQEADHLKDERTLVQIEIDRLERQFLIAWLEKRESIALMESSAA